MKVGDLVTLSQYGSNLESCWRHHRDWMEGKLVGLLTEIYESKQYWNKGTYYGVQWINPRHRSLSRMKWDKAGLFTRKDLKMYKVSKKNESR